MNEAAFFKPADKTIHSQNTTLRENDRMNNRNKTRYVHEFVIQFQPESEAEWNHVISAESCPWRATSAPPSAVGKLHL